MEVLHNQARTSADYLGRDLEDVFSEGIVALGLGKFRSRVVEERDKTRHLLLNKALETFPDQEARPVWSWPELDKCSSQYLGCLPTGDTVFTLP